MLPPIRNGDIFMFQRNNCADVEATPATAQWHCFKANGIAGQPSQATL
jgi:hypothetical protein